MKSKYEIVWQDHQHKVLQILSLENPTWYDILDAALRALEIVKSEPHDVVSFQNSHQYPVDTASIGTMKDIFFNQLPKAPKNLKGVVILVPPSQKNMLEAGIGTIANIWYSHNFMQVVDSYETANQLLIQKLG